MTKEYIKSKIEHKVKNTKDTSCLIYYLLNTFQSYFTNDEIFEIVNNITTQRPKSIYKSPFKLGN